MAIRSGMAASAPTAPPRYVGTFSTEAMKPFPNAFALHGHDRKCDHRGNDAKIWLKTFDQKRPS